MYACARIACTFVRDCGFRIAGFFLLSLGGRGRCRVKPSRVGSHSLHNDIVRRLVGDIFD